ncbi:MULTISPECIES: GspE/PulE family protein [unclassified Oleiphilus]|jgi:general secretion pathway protein E|uniref:GspE/PulE family protein n=4 Tax=Oleiphilus TaxID=141450 RepID=UPI0007C27ABA|nr:MULTISPECIES: GspE/PulE family protein [unclassified Oleiphilus]KZY74405.1 type II secretion system protein E [Oleiphilus sp. HI0068]KZY80617.1 type II secretion system protein E [Oleiphilus sp. HI0069]KZY88310.1 type II secretion system protein E [Oleiphilus sp. HI0072]KZZ17106.1 type II secretion system protein E [Oleiphilus sp. HI0078]KZY35286.1 type II secretion system protein E [Oleiphilus sp. HI0043]
MQQQFSHSEPLTFGQIVHQLQQDKWLSEEDAKALLIAPKGSAQAKLHPLEIIANAELSKPSGEAISIESLLNWLSTWSGQEVFQIDPLKIDSQKVANVMSLAFAQRHHILAVEINSEEAVIASAQPFVDHWENDLKHILKKNISRVIVSPADLRKYTVEFYHLANSVNKAGAQTSSQHSQNFEQMLELGAQGNPDANDQHIINIVDWLLQYAFEQRASDIHIEPRREISQVRFRIDGVLHNVYEFPAKVGIAVTSRFKILGRLNVAEKRKPQDGRIKTRNSNEKEIELRLSTLPTAFGEKLVMRVFDPEVLQCSFSELGFSSEDLKRWKQMTGQPNGIILVTGPTGSGKTTTLYSTLRELATPEVNVSTIEDPIEMVEPAFNQMQIQQNIDLDFASGIKALMRQDPDIIMIGEIRDLETAEMAIQAALTGHLVISTLHTNDAPSAITRLMELGIPPYLIKATVLGVMAQRLVRTLCTSCKTPVELEEEDWKMLTRPWKTPLPQNAQQPVGCQECRQTGYRGRAGVYEIMPLSESLKGHIHESGQVAELRKEAIKEGMYSLRLSGANKIANGLTTIDEVLRVTPVSLNQLMS